MAVVAHGFVVFLEFAHEPHFLLLASAYVSKPGIETKLGHPMLGPRLLASSRAPEGTRTSVRPAAGNVLAVHQNQADYRPEGAASLKTSAELFALFRKQRMERTASSEVLERPIEGDALLENIYRAPLTPGATNRHGPDRLEHVREADARLRRPELVREMGTSTHAPSDSRLGNALLSALSSQTLGAAS